MDLIPTGNGKTVLSAGSRGDMGWSRLNLDAIEVALRQLGSTDNSEDLSGLLHEEPITSDMLRRLLEAYRYADWLLEQRIDLFGYGASRHLLELNHLVLCGSTPDRRREYADHIVETERMFYERPGADFGSLIDWHKRNVRAKPVSRAAGFFLRIVSSPQLFVEGNGRTASVLASYVLARDDHAPFVATEACFHEYVGLVNRCAAIDRRTFSSMFSVEITTRRVAHFFESSCDHAFLVASERARMNS